MFGLCLTYVLILLHSFEGFSELLSNHFEKVAKRVFVRLVRLWEWLFGILNYLS
jgi:hypothetical protein